MIFRSTKVKLFISLIIALPIERLSFIIKIHPNVLIFTKGYTILVQVTMLDHLLDTVYVCQNFD